MRLVVCSWLTLAALCACSGGSSTGFSPDSGTGGGGSGSGSGSGGDVGGGGDDGGTAGNLGGGSGSGSGSGGGAQGDASVVVTTTIYANTDDSLYSMDPKTKAVSLVGKFAGMGGGTNDTSITDVAVNGAGAVYANSESVVYVAALPSGGTGTVQLKKVAQIQTTGKFYALGFTSADALGAGTGEVLIGGDINGELWSIDTSSGATKDLGNFGTDPDDSTRFLSLSGDVVFYVDASNKPKGIATIRSCAPGASGKSPSCTKTDDVLAAIDLAALGAAYTSGTPAKSLNGGMYGGSATTKGSGTGHGEVFGLGAWEGSVFGFSRNMTSPTTPPALYSIDTSNGVGSALPGASFAFTNGWSGAGVTSKVTVTVSPPPPPPPPPK